MNEGAAEGDSPETVDDDRANEAQSAGRTTDGMFIEIGGNGDGYVTVSAGRTIAALVAVVGAIAIVAILAHPRLARDLLSGVESPGDGRMDDGTDGAADDPSEGPTRRQSASAGPER